ncbi:DUF2335 domain-containing protein [Prodigiosinella confusarubida]|uniref:DUF2335 domain-containing protein n=1 Tax=Serratia sp. (strain ATCC 39006) TaxID=104623 RepID=A0A2I5T5B2_SERS3|nr:DUF2335 domain-containing protein [Serratia sp. ATCC 39006]AUG99757.1 DUF2335 domain-containing protein [Serratia sp. ATCC 39006]AUH04076.1 DUF2335 domain-containing protein [Serratia sp. ATCC 39006]
MNAKSNKGQLRNQPVNNGNRHTQELSQKIAEQISLAVKQDPELKGKIPPEIVERLSRNQVMISRFSSTERFEGPFPHPQTLEQYNKVLPGAAERVFALTEREQLHRHGLQNTAVNGTISRDKRGQWMGYTITILVLLIAVYFAYRGNTAFAGTLITVDLVALAAIFVSGRGGNAKENQSPPST